MENEYYRAVALDWIRKVRPSRYRVQAKIIRKDSGELVWVVSISIKKPDEKISALDAAVRAKMAEFGKPPDWPRSSVAPVLLKRYLAFVSEHYESCFDPGEMSIEDQARWRQ